MQPVKAAAPGAPNAHRNEVALVGRIAAAPEQRELPSGDLIVVWRLVVERSARARTPETSRSATVDTLDCVAWSAGVQRSVTRFAAGDVVAVSGSLRRRFWRSGAATVSRYEVEVDRVKRLQKAEQQSR